jgi:hypothetical protein
MIDKISECVSVIAIRVEWITPDLADHFNRELEGVGHQVPTENSPNPHLLTCSRMPEERRK